ncbi:CaiB/BaiF CoA transferase family protein [Pseudahrensia aquimaris]|uniref:CaiB/BaiF CoA transferase family protein n=1 Tax=Pseudahrensia aquimaris TaxID=744461 RepID=A0ABW3FGZ7_9HYPH
MKPLAGIRIVEIASIGPGPFCAMMLADHGADIIRIEKPGGRDIGTSRSDSDPLLRGRRKVELDLKDADDVEKALALIEKADGLIEGFRPGVMERLGLGPEKCHTINPALVFGRMTGWGQDGPLAKRAGHDINYIALTGALDTVGSKTSGPVPALNLIGDFGGGGMLLAFGMVSALLAAKTSRKGSVVDAAMVEGAALLMTMTYGLKAQGLWDGGRSDNLLDGGAPFYGTYETSDGGWMAVGAIEEPFWQELVEKLELKSDLIAKRYDKAVWEELGGQIAARFKSHTRAHWEKVFDGSDACVAPVLSMEEAPRDRHVATRQALRKSGGVMQPAPAPRYNGVVPELPETNMSPQDFDAVLKEWN